MAARSRELPTPLAILLVVLVLARVAGVTSSATGRVRGDFYASMPGAHVERLNPTLWNSADLGEAWGYHRSTYYHGPTQYLTLYPLSFLDSFAEVATVLLALYAAVLALTFWLMWLVAKRLGADRGALVPLFASTFLFFPLLQAYLQREFEVVLTLMFAVALWLLLNDRKSWAGALVAYAAWFKYVPLLFAGYFAWRRWWRALVAFVAASAAIVVLSEWLFGLSLFFNNNVPGHARQAFVLWGYGFNVDATGHLHGTGFCGGWLEHDTTLANLRHGLCSMAVTRPWLNPPAIYLAICAAVAAAYLMIERRLARAALPAASEQRRRAIEVSIVVTICACFFFAHYYYLILLVIPFNVLLAIYLADGRGAGLWLWAVSYFLVGAFVVPSGLLSRLAGFNVFELYMWQSWFWYGEILLVALLLFEYHRLGAAAMIASRSIR
jgi:hypothetical protein